MDPASIIGLVGAIVGIADVIVKSVNALKQFQDDYEGADFRVGALIAQLLTIKAALGNVAEMINEASSSITVPSPFSRQFIEDLRMSLYGCEAMVCALDSKLSNLRRNEHNGLSASSRFHMAMQDSTLDEYLVMLNNQTSALQLLLTTLHCRSAVARSEMLYQTSARHVFAQVKDDTSSLLWLYDEESLLSLRSNGTQQDLSTISTEFSFDSDLITSKVYRTAMRSHMIYAIGSSRDSVRNPRRPATPSSGFRMSRRFSIRSDRVSIPETASVRSDKETIRDSASIASNMHLLPPIQGLEPLLIQVQGKAPLEDAQSIMSDVGTMYTGDASLRRFWHRRKQPKVPAAKVLQAVAPAFAPKNATNVLVLGLPSTGKSTLTKSLLYSYGCLDVETRLSYVEDIHRETLESLRTVVRESRMDRVLSRCNLEAAYDTLWGVKQGAYFQEDSMTPDMIRACSAFCKDPVFQAKVADLYKQQQLYNLAESAQHFFNSIERITMPKYIPSASDVLRSYQMTLGITVTNVEAKGRSYNIFDLSGYHEERQWQRVIHRADVVVYTFDVSRDSEGVKYDANAGTSMDRQIDVLKETLNDARLLASKVIILFTKVDKLTPEAVHRLSQSMLYVYHQGPETVDGVLDFLARKLSLELEGVQKRLSFGKTPKRVTFWRTSIAESSTEMADVVLTALEQLEDSIEEEDEDEAGDDDAIPAHVHH